MRFIRWICVILTLLSVNALAAIESSDQAINQASRQGMLTQLMLKNYIMVGMSVRARKADQDLKTAIQEYESLQQEMLGYATGDALKGALQRTQEEWQKVKPLYLKRPDKQNVNDVRQKTEALLQQWNVVVGVIVENSDSKYSSLIGNAGFIRMLSQRVSSHYALMAWGMRDKYSDPFNRALEMFENNRDQLESSPLNDTEIQKELGKIQRDFKRFKGLSNSDPNKALLALVTRSAEKITLSMDRVVGLYQAQGN